MGANMSARLANDGHHLVVTDLDADAVSSAAEHDNVTGADDSRDAHQPTRYPPARLGHGSLRQPHRKRD